MAETLAYHGRHVDETVGLGVEQVNMAVGRAAPYIALRTRLDEHNPVGGQHHALLGRITERGKAIAIVITKPVPRRHPHKTVGSLHETGYDIGSKPVADGKRAHIAIRLCNGADGTQHSCHNDYETVSHLLKQIHSNIAKLRKKHQNTQAHAVKFTKTTKQQTTQCMKAKDRRSGMKPMDGHGKQQPGLQHRRRKTRETDRQATANGTGNGTRLQTVEKNPMAIDEINAHNGIGK